VVLERLAVAGPASDAVASAVDDVLATDVAHAVEVLGALVALRAEPAPAPLGDPASTDGDHPLLGALGDELTLVRSRVLAALLARYGTQRLGPVTASLTGVSAPAPLAIEALEVVLGASLAARLTPVLDTRDPPEARLRQLVARTGPAASGGGARAVLTDLVEDPRQAWRSTWLRACAVRAAGDWGVTGDLDLVPARTLGDPMVDEELDRIR
jgi:hypothetical protein